MIPSGLTGKISAQDMIEKEPLSLNNFHLTHNFRMYLQKIPQI